MEEIWKEIEWYEGLYYISSLWRVKSRNKILSPQKHKWWDRVQLVKDWKPKSYFIAYLMWEKEMGKKNNNKLWQEYLNLSPKKIIHRVWFNKLISRGMTVNEIYSWEYKNRKEIKYKWGEEWKTYLEKATTSPYSRQWFYRLMNKWMSVEDILSMDRSENMKRIGHWKRRVDYTRAVNMYLSWYKWKYIKEILKICPSAVNRRAKRYYWWLKFLKKSSCYL